MPPLPVVSGREAAQAFQKIGFLAAENASFAPPIALTVSKSGLKRLEKTCSTFVARARTNTSHEHE